MNRYSRKKHKPKIMVSKIFTSLNSGLTEKAGDLGLFLLKTHDTMLKGLMTKQVRRLVSLLDHVEERNAEFCGLYTRVFLFIMKKRYNNKEQN